MKLIGLLLWSALCFGIGQAAGDDQVKVEEKVVTKTEIKEVKVTVEKSVLPASCKTALDLTVERNKAAVGIDKASAQQLDIISKARQSLASTGELNNLETQQRGLQGRTVAHVLTMSRTDKQYADAYATCMKELNK